MRAHRRPVTAPVGPADDLDRGGEELETDALQLGVVDLGAVRRHLLATAAVGHSRFPRTESERSPRRVHGDIAAPDDDNALPRQVGGTVELDRAEEFEAGEDAGRSSPGTPRLVESGVPVASRTASQPAVRRSATSSTRDPVAISTPSAVTFAMSCATTSGGRR